MDKSVSFLDTLKKLLLSNLLYLAYEVTDQTNHCMYINYAIHLMQDDYDLFKKNTGC